jgi:hypothetical protein
MKQYRYEFERPVRRSQEVRSIVGRYQITMLPPSIEKLRDEYEKLVAGRGTRYSFSRWLMMDKQVNPVDVGKICKTVSENASVEVVISDRYNDLLRLADTSHFDSCLKPDRQGDKVPRKLLQSPDFGVMYIPDKSGKFMGRTIFKAGPEYQIYRCYGTLSFELATKVLHQLDKVVHTNLEDIVSVMNYGREQQAGRLIGPVRRNDLDFLNDDYEMPVGIRWR